jgi:ligand-binding sensor domain-containing protein
VVSRRLVLVAALATFVTSSAAGRRLPVRLFTIADDLPQNEINCLLEDSRGFLWVGTSDGFACFDGLLDLVCRFATALTGFQVGDAEGVLKGESVEGVPIIGSDSINVVH